MRHHFRPRWQFLRRIGPCLGGRELERRPRPATSVPIQSQFLPGSDRAREYPLHCSPSRRDPRSGLETAACAHIRVADETTFFGLPEGKRGIYIGGGGSV